MFDPEQAAYDIRLSGAGGVSLPDSVSFSYQLFSLDGYTRVVTVNGTTEEISDHGESSPISLPVGTTTINIVVSASDGTATTSKTYTFKFVRDVSQNADLSYLEYMTVTDNVYDEVNYYSGIPILLDSHKDSILVTPVTADPHSKTTIDGGAPLNSGESQSIPLTAGTNTLTVVVTAEDGKTQQTYTITIENPVPPSS